MRLSPVKTALTVCHRDEICFCASRSVDSPYIATRYFAGQLRHPYQFDRSVHLQYVNGICDSDSSKNIRPSICSHSRSCRVKKFGSI
jgi:hypothetical protein